jgi:predicted RND superfamily exporter protein
MHNVSLKIEMCFALIGRGVYRYRFIALLAVVVLFIVISSQINQLSIDTSNDAFYEKNDPVLVEYNQFRKQFGKDDHIYIGFKPKNIFDSTFLNLLQRLQTEIEKNVPHINKTTSLLNIRNTYGFEDDLIVEDFIGNIPNLKEALQELKTDALKNVFYQNYILSADGSFTFIDIEPTAVTLKKSSDGQQIEKFVSTDEYREITEKLVPILSKYREEGLDSYAAGFPMVTDRLTRAIEKSIAELTPISLLLNVSFLILLFRYLSGVIYPMLIVVLTIVSTLGIMAWLRIPIDLVTTILPTLISVVAIADSVHILLVFYKEFEKNGGNKQRAIEYAMSRTGPAILMTSITSAVGLLSFVLADLAPVAHLGIIAPIAILLAFFYSIILLPAMISVFPVFQANREDSLTNISDQLLDWLAEFTFRRYKIILILGGSLLLACVFGIMQLSLSHNSLNWLPEDDKVRVDTQIIDKAIGGSMPVEVIIDTQKEHGIYDPEFIETLQKVADKTFEFSSGNVMIGKNFSIHTILKEVNRALHSNQDEYYQVPKSRELIAQELLLFEMSAGEDLRKLVDYQYSKVRFSIMLPFTDALQIKPVLDNIKSHFNSEFPDSKISITGIAPMFVETMFDVLRSMFKSYGFAFIAITLLMILFIGHLKLGLVSMVPNLFPIIVVMGVMGWTNIPFDFSNMLVGSVVIGLVVDDTIHFMHHLKRHLNESGNIKIAVNLTLHSTGRAIFITSLVLASGMFVAMNSDLISTANFGLLTGLAIILALLADFFLVPALMFTLYDKTEHY